MLGAVYSFNRVTKRPQFRPLLESGQKINLNLFTLFAAYFRNEDDPLKPAHKKIAKIGFIHFFGMIFGTFAISFAILTILSALGIKI